MLEPSIDNFKEIVEDYEEIIKIVTLAPEIEGASNLIKYLNDKKIVASIGHTNATYEEALCSIKMVYLMQLISSMQ